MYIAVVAQVVGTAYGCPTCGGFVAGYIATGTLKGAVIGAAVAAVFGATGKFASGWGVAGQAAASGTVGGAISVAQGGSFRAGFTGAALGSLASGWGGDGAGWSAARIGAGALAGGLGARTAGGDFDDGARMGAFGAVAGAAAREYAQSRREQKCRGCEVSISDKSRSSLEQMFGESVDGIKVYENSLFAELHGATATTRANAIYLSINGAEFLANPRLMLEEYYYVIEQWNTGDLTVTKYVMENMSNGNGYAGNRYEVQAKQFARENVWRYESLVGGP